MQCRFWCRYNFWARCSDTFGVDLRLILWCSQYSGYLPTRTIIEIWTRWSNLEWPDLQLIATTWVTLKFAILGDFPCYLGNFNMRLKIDCGEQGDPIWSDLIWSSDLTMILRWLTWHNFTVGFWILDRLVQILIAMTTEFLTGLLAQLEYQTASNKGRSCFLIWVLAQFDYQTAISEGRASDDCKENGSVNWNSSKQWFVQ